MGGTSADASLVTGGAALTEGSETVAGIPLALHSILIETVSAGGGSIASIDEGGALRVGPRSAGAEPGPACYGRGGTEPTVTDACLILGWLSPTNPLGGVVHLDEKAARQALARLPVAGIIAVATAIMARALKRVSVARGLDPREMTLLPFGGAGPLFGCALADALGMSRVVIPPYPGVLSALGLAAASERVETVRSLHRATADLDAQAIAQLFAPLLASASEALPGAQLIRYADCRFAGQGYEVTVTVQTDDPRALGTSFLVQHEKRHGHADPARPVEVVNLRVVAERTVKPPTLGRNGAPPGKTKPGRRRITLRDGRLLVADVWALGELVAGQRITGPAILPGSDATALIEPDWTGVVHESGAVIVERGGA